MPWIKCLGGGGGKARRGKALTVSQPVHLLVKTEFEPQCHVFRTKQLRRPRPCHLCHQAMIKQASCCRVCEYTCHKTCEDKLFDTLRTVSTGVESKIHLINGDLIQDDIALSETDRNTLINEVNIILHNASNVKFMEKMGIALKVNVLGTKAMLDLAKQCKHIEGFMYMSTAYSHCYQKNIMEEAYPSPADMKTVYELIATDSETSTGISGEDLLTILDKFPTTYTFTKAIAEGLVNDTGKEVSFPCLVYRPAVVISSWKEPVRGWCGNMNGPALIYTGVTLGLVHTTLGGDAIFDMIPVDMTINALLVAIWDSVNKSAKVSGAHVYNYGSSVENPISMKPFHEYCIPGGEVEEPSIHTVWKHFFFHTKCTWYFMILHVLFHYIPAIIVDSYLYISGKKPRALSTLKKVANNYKLLMHFVHGEWKIDISNVNKAIDKMNSIDRELFFCDVKKLDWKEYGSSYCRGLRKYILKDPMLTLPAARRRYRIFAIIHYTIKYAIMLFIGYIIAKTLDLL